MLPMVTMYNIHWNIRDMPERKSAGFVDPSEFKFGLEFLMELFYYFNIMYFGWAMIYYFIILVVSRQKIKDRGYWTLLQMSIDNSKIASNLRDKYGMWAA